MASSEKFNNVERASELSERERGIRPIKGIHLNRSVAAPVYETLLILIEKKFLDPLIKIEVYSIVRVHSFKS